MTVGFKKEDRTWYFRFQVGGDRFYQQGFATEKEANDAEAKQRVFGTNSGGQRAAFRDVTLSDVARLYFRDHLARQKYGADCKHKIEVICEMFGDKRLAEVTKYDVIDLRDKLARRGLKPITVNGYHGLIKAAFKWWINEKELNLVNPFGRVKFEKTPKARVRFMSPAEEMVLTPAIFEKARLWPYYLAGLYTGIRVSNLTTLRVADVDPTLGHLFIRDSKGHVSASLPIDPVLWPWVELWMRDKKATDSLLPPADRFYIGHAFPELAESVGVKELPFHCLRHTFVWFHLRREEPLYKVSKLLMHKNQAVTETHYGHMAIEDLRPGATKPEHLVSEKYTKMLNEWHEKWHVLKNCGRRNTRKHLTSNSFARVVEGHTHRT